MHDERVTATDVLEDFHVDFAVRKPADVGARKRNAEIAGNVLRELRVGIARKNRH